MKRYIKEMANDVQREIDKEIKACNIPFGKLADLGKDINIILRDYRYGLLTDRDSASAILIVWDKLKELQWENS